MKRRHHGVVSASKYRLPKWEFRWGRLSQLLYHGLDCILLLLWSEIFFLNISSFDIVRILYHLSRHFQVYSLYENRNCGFGCASFVILEVYWDNIEFYWRGSEYLQDKEFVMSKGYMFLQIIQSLFRKTVSTNNIRWQIFLGFTILHWNSCSTYIYIHIAHTYTCIHTDIPIYIYLKYHEVWSKSCSTTVLTVL